VSDTAEKSCGLAELNGGREGSERRRKTSLNCWKAKSSESNFLMLYPEGKIKLGRSTESVRHKEKEKTHWRRILGHDDVGERRRSVGKREKKISIFAVLRQEEMKVAAELPGLEDRTSKTEE